MRAKEAEVTAMTWDGLRYMSSDLKLSEVLEAIAIYELENES